MANHERDLQLLRIYPTNVLARRPNSLLQPSGKSIGALETFALGLCCDRINRDWVYTPAQESVSARRLVLVRGDARSGDRNCTGRFAGTCGPVHLSAANRFVRCDRLADPRSDKIVAAAKSDSRVCGDDHSW